MNEPFVRKIYESGSDSVGSGIQDGLNFYGQQFKNLIESFPTVDAPIFLAAMKSVHDGIRGVIPENGADLEDDILQHVTTFVIPFPGARHVYDPGLPLPPLRRAADQQRGCEERHRPRLPHEGPSGDAGPEPGNGF